MNTFLGGINGTKQGITPALNNKIYDRAEEILKKSGKKDTRKNFNDAFDLAIVEFGYTPSYYKKVMRQFGQNPF